MTSAPLARRRPVKQILAAERYDLVPPSVATCTGGRRAAPSFTPAVAVALTNARTHTLIPTYVHTDASVAAPPSRQPRPRYCDVTGLPVRPRAWPRCLHRAASVYALIRPRRCVRHGTPQSAHGQANYRDPKTGLYYYSAEIYAVIKDMSPERVQQYLAVRGAAVKLG